MDGICGICDKRKIIYNNCCAVCICLIYKGAVVANSEKINVKAILGLLYLLELWSVAEYPHIRVVSRSFKV